MSLFHDSFNLIHELRLPHLCQLFGRVVLFPGLWLDREYVMTIPLGLIYMNHTRPLQPPSCCVCLAIAPTRNLRQRVNAFTWLLVYRVVKLKVGLAGMGLGVGEPLGGVDSYKRR